VTGMTSMLGSISTPLSSPASAAVLNEPVLTDIPTISTRPTSDPDEQRWADLMVSAQAGNESDYRQLLTDLTDVIYHFLRSRFGNHHFIEDCVQESLIAIHQARHTYDRHRRFRPWLFAIVRHKAIDTLRKQTTRQRITGQYKADQEILSQTSQQSEVESELIRGRLLDSLPKEFQDALVLTKLIGFSVAETAEKLGISRSLVKVRVHRAIRKLSHLMETDQL
jgi:RNA polymerase sigma-70 factor (ECF subfamily)